MRARSAAPCQGFISSVCGDVINQTLQGTEDLLVLFAIGSQFDAVIRGHDERDLQDVDGIQAQTFSVKGLLRINLIARDSQIQCLDDEVGYFPPQPGIVSQRCRRTLSEAFSVIG